MQVNGAAEKLGETGIARRERRPVSLHAVALRDEGPPFEVLVLDLSYEGCGIETPAELRPGEQIKLSVIRLGGIDARVRWCSDGKAGLVFEPVEVQPQHWPRCSERTQLSAEVSMRRLGKFNYRVRVFDVSPEGCKVELVERPRIDEHVFIRFEGLEALDCAVCWLDGMTAGLRFERAIHPAVFALLLERLR